MTATPTTSENLVFNLSRVFNAPRELVFRAWHEPTLMKQWSAPRGFTVTQCEGAFCPGGAWRACMQSPSGEELWLGGTYREIVPGERVVFTHRWDEERCRAD